MSNFWKNASIMSIAEIFLKLKGFIMMPFITKYLGTLNYGIWSQVMVVVSMVTPLVFLGMDSSLFRYLPGLPDDQQRRDFSGWLYFGILSSALILLLIYVLSYQLSDLLFGSKEEYPIFVILAGFNVVTTTMLAGVRAWFRVKNQAWSLVILTVMQNLLQMLVLVGVLIANQGIYELVLYSLICDICVVLGYIIYLLNKRVLTLPSFNWFNKYFKFGIVLLPSGYAVWVLNSLDRIFLAQYHNLVDIGVYSICFTIGYTLIQVIVNPIWNLFPTKAAELYNMGNIPALESLLNQSVKLILWIILPSILGLIVVGKQFLAMITTPEFASGYLVTPIILAGYLCSMLSSYFETILSLKNKQYLSSVFTVFVCTLNIGLNFILIPKYSYHGAAIATTLSFACQNGLSYYFTRKEKLVKFNWFPILKISSASIVMFIAINLLKNMSIFFIVPLGVALYFVLSYMLRIYDLKAIFKNIIQGENYASIY